MSILSVERYSVPAAAREDFERLLADLVADMRREAGFLWAEGGRTDDDESYVLLSEWRTTGDLDAWLATSAVAAWEASTDPLLTGDPTRRRFVPSGS